MPANKRLFYAVQAVGFSKCGISPPSYTSLHGCQSVSINTKFNLEQVFELGQLAIYDTSEGIPDIDCTIEKALDGYCPAYLLATNGATSATLAGRSNVKATIALSLYSDVQDSASGTPIAQVTLSGVYPNTIGYNFQTEGPATESIGFVGNNKTWLTSSFLFTPTFTNADTPLAGTASGNVQRRQNLLMGSGSTYCQLPKDIPGISTVDGYNYLTAGELACHVQSVKPSTSLGREQLFELGRRGPYHRYAQFPVSVKTDIEIINIAGDRITANEDDVANTSDQTIILRVTEGLVINLGTKNRLSSVSHQGGNAQANGGNVTSTYSYENFNDMKVTHPQDPSALS